MCKIPFGSQMKSFVILSLRYEVSPLVLKNIATLEELEDKFLNIWG